MERDWKPPKILSEKEYASILAKKNAKRAAMLATMTRINEALIGDGLTTGAVIYPGWKDINSYFPLPSAVLHVQLNPVPDNKRKLMITMKILDLALWEEER